MDTKYRKRYFSINRKDFDIAEPILDWYYTHSDWDELTVEDQVCDDKILIGVRCDSDDFEAVQKKLQDAGVTVF